MKHIVGVVTATTHIHQTLPKDSAPAGGNKNVNLAIKSYVWDENRVRHEVPFVTGNSVRGLLRRAAAAIVLDRINAPVSRQLFQTLTTGKSGRDAIGAQPTVAALTEASNAPFAGLFGGGPYMLASRYSMAPLFPIVEWCKLFLHPSLIGQMIPADRLTAKNHETGATFDIPLTTQIVLTGRDDFLAGKGQGRVRDYETSFSAWLQEIGMAAAAKAESKNAAQDARRRGEVVRSEDIEKAKDISTYAFIEAILPGTPLQFWLRIKDGATDAQVGMMLEAVRDWANQNVLGGASARGFGRFTVDLALYDDKASTKEPVVTSIFKAGDGELAYVLHDDVRHYVDAAEAALNGVSEESLLVTFPPVESGKKKGGKAKGTNKESSDE